MAFTTKKVSRVEFEENLSENLNDIAFIKDIKPLLPRNIYDAYNPLPMLSLLVGNAIIQALIKIIQIDKSHFIKYLYKYLFNNSRSLI
jgi:hypothetical protein